MKQDHEPGKYPLSCLIGFGVAVIAFTFFAATVLITLGHH